MKVGMTEFWGEEKPTHHLLCVVLKTAWYQSQNGEPQDNIKRVFNRMEKKKDNNNVVLLDLFCSWKVRQRDQVHDKHHIQYMTEQGAQVTRPCPRPSTVILALKI